MGNHPSNKLVQVQKILVSQSFPSFLESRVLVICINCHANILQNNNKKRQTYIRCLSGHAVCLNCWHEYISEVLDHQLPVIQCCANVSPKCMSGYNLPTLINQLSLEEYKSFMRIYGEVAKIPIPHPLLQVVSSYFSQKEKSVKKIDYNITLPFVYPKAWCVLEFSCEFFFMKEW
jgi:hypothetical protein